MRCFGSCPVCGSDLFGRKCRNLDDSDIPCLGLSDEDAAIEKAHRDYVTGALDTAGLERAVWVALTNPPRRRFSTILELR